MEGATLSRPEPQDRPTARELASSSVDMTCPSCGCAATEGRATCRCCGRPYAKTQRYQLCTIAARPMCPTHGDTMRAGSSQPRLTYYYCTINGCSESGKVPRA